MLLQEYDFEVVTCTGMTNLDAHEFSSSPSREEQDLTGPDDMEIVIEKQFVDGTQQHTSY